MMHTWLRLHRMAIVLAFMVGVIASAPTLLSPLLLGKENKGVPFAFMDDEDIYRARVQEILDGHHTVTSAYLYEYKDSASAPQPPIHEWLYAVPAMLFGLTTVFVASKFLLPAVLFFLVYASVFVVVRRIEESNAVVVSLAAGLLVTLGFDFVHIGNVLGQLQGTVDPGLLVWARMVNPIIGGLEVFLGLFLLLQLRMWKYVYVGLGALVALSVGYFFSYGMILALMGSFFLFALVQRDFLIAKRVVLAGILSLFLSASYWWNMLSVVSGEVGRELALRNGMYFTHTPVLNKMLLATTLIVCFAFLYAWWKRIAVRQSYSWAVVFSLLLASWTVFNQQILTGRVIWYHHFVQYVIPICFVALLLAGTLTLGISYKRVWRWMVFFISVLCLLYGVSTLRTVWTKHAEFAEEQNRGAVYHILNAAPRDCVVLTVGFDTPLERTIPAFTHCNVYTTTSTFFGVPQERILHNYLLQLRLAGVDPEEARTYMLSHESGFRSAFFGDWDQLFGSGQDGWLQGKVDEVDAAYRKFVMGNLQEQVRSYRVDFVISTTPLSPSLLAQLPGLSLASTTPGFFLYSF